MSFFYLCFPAKFSILESHKREHHLTMKFFGPELGASKIQLVTARTLADEDWLIPPDPASLIFEPATFHEGVTVLKAVSYPFRMLRLHDAFRDIAADQFNPWHPHITIATGSYVWDELKKRKLFSGSDLGLSFDALELRFGKNLINTFGTPRGDLH